MKNKIVFDNYIDIQRIQEISVIGDEIFPGIISENDLIPIRHISDTEQAEILVITSYPPRECGIATYSQDLIKALNKKFSSSLLLNVCALESGDSNFSYPPEVKFVLNTTQALEFETLAIQINHDAKIKIVLIQHEFGFFNQQDQAFIRLLKELNKPVVIVFHTVLPHPDEAHRGKVIKIAAECESVVVMTKSAAKLLENTYGIPVQKISIIAHGTHLVQHKANDSLKKKYGIRNRKVLTTFGLLSSGKSIETTIEALPAIVSKCPEVLFLVIGKTHPEVVKKEGEDYRNKLEARVMELRLTKHVQFINSFLALPELLEYLQLTDIYLFTTDDPNQAVSGTFAYAMSCACPIISTPIPHAKEVLTEDTGIIIDFHNSSQLAESALRLLNNDDLRKNISSNTLQKIVSTAWENSAVLHAMLFENIVSSKLTLQYELPAINLDHLKDMTTQTGIIQFSQINQPDLASGYTLDDNARALVASCMYFDICRDKEILNDIHRYLGFVKRCLQPHGNFMNYMDADHNFTDQNMSTNLDDSNGRAVWALGYTVSLIGVLPYEIIVEADSIMRKALLHAEDIHSTRAMAFLIKGIFYHQRSFNSSNYLILMKTLADRLVHMYNHETEEEWQWFESYLTYANSILPEAMLYAWLSTGDLTYRDVALSSFRFLLSRTFNENGIEVISNKKWLIKGEEPGHFGEQPIDVAYTVMTLSKFYDVFKVADFRQKMETAFSWFLGKNRLNQIIYNPCTGGCYDGLEENHVNLNQGAESTVSYLMARLTIGKYRKTIV